MVLFLFGGFELAQTLAGFAVVGVEFDDAFVMRARRFFCLACAGMIGPWDSSQFRPEERYP